MFMFRNFAATADGVWTFIIIFKLDLARPTRGPLGAPRGAEFGFREFARLVLSAFVPLLSHATDVRLEGCAVPVAAELPGPGFRTFLVGPFWPASLDGSLLIRMLRAMLEVVAL